MVDLARRHTPPPAPRFRPRIALHARKQPGPSTWSAAAPATRGSSPRAGWSCCAPADVVVHDRLIGPELLAEARADAELIDVGKGPGHAPYAQAEINALLVARARLGRTVVRLKGGDPFVFGRGSEEAEACRAAGVPVYVVPGVSSAIAGPAAAGIPVTARGTGALVRGGHRARCGTDGEAPDLSGAGAGGHAGGADGPREPRPRSRRSWSRPAAIPATPGRLHPERHDARAAGHPRDARHHRRGGGPGRTGEPGGHRDRRGRCVGTDRRGAGGGSHPGEAKGA